jgi:hypothetical protein
MAKRMLVLVFGSVLLVFGICVAIAGGALMLVFGSDSTISSGQETFATHTNALVASIDDIKDINGIAEVVGKPTLGLTAIGTREVFIGIGPAGAVERYLGGTSIDRVTDLDVDPFKLKTKPRAGTATPDAPAAQTFWTTSASGANASVNWKVSDGSYRLVLMNVDATAGVTTDGRVQLKVPNLFGIGIGVLVAGVVLGLIGLWLLLIGARMHSYGPPPAGAAGYQGPGYPAATEPRSG